MWLQRSNLFAITLLVVVSSGADTKAQVQPDTPPEETTSLRTVTTAEYRGHLESLKALVQACQKNADECDSKKIGDDEGIEGAGFQARWSWLRDTISSAHDERQPDRERSLAIAAARLDEDTALEADTTEGGGTFQRARRQADDVLSRPEFRTVVEESYLERKIARFWQWVADVFGGVSRLGKRSPWLVPFVEWGSITLAAAGVLTWAFQRMQRQRLAVRFESSVVTELWQRESDNWAELAKAEAARQEWREAVHCLYWATIVMMEGRKLWRQNRARTPREYLSLLEPESGMQQALRRLTQIFERIWYGLRPASESDYAKALSLFEELRTA
jgi:hypothetical protein